MKKIILFVLCCAFALSAYSETLSEEYSRGRKNTVNSGEKKQQFKQTLDANSCPVFDYRPASKVLPKAVQIGGLCYAYATAAMLSLLSVKAGQSDFYVSPEDVASIAAYLPAADKANAEKRDSVYMAYYSKAKKSIETVLHNRPQDFTKIFALPIKDLRELYGFKELFVKEGNDDLKIFLIANALTDRTIYFTAHMNGNYEDYVKSLLSQKHTVKFAYAVETYFPDYALVKDKPEYNNFLTASAIIKKDAGNYYTYDSGFLGNVAAALNKGQRVCAIKNEHFLKFNFVAENFNKFFLPEDKFNAFVDGQPLTDNQKQAARNAYTVVNRSGINTEDYGVDKAERSFQRFVLQRVVEKNQHLMCHDEVKAPQYSVSLDYLGFGPNFKYIFVKPKAPVPVTNILKNRKPFVIGYATAYDDGHAVAVIGVEKKGDDCLAIIQDSNMVITPPKFMTFTDGGDGFWRVKTGELNAGVNAALYIDAAGDVTPIVTDPN